MTKKCIYTIGHSTHSIEEFVQLLQAYHIALVVDIRTIPKSRHNPQFNEEELKKSLKKSHIAYQHLPKLGGLRHALKDSLNQGWHNASFRGFADYMQTASFCEGLEELENAAKGTCTVIMCAEAVPWRCHRALIADALLRHKWEVIDIFSSSNAKKHAYTPFLKIVNGNLLYP